MKNKKNNLPDVWRQEQELMQIIAAGCILGLIQMTQNKLKA